MKLTLLSSVGKSEGDMPPLIGSCQICYSAEFDAKMLIAMHLGSGSQKVSLFGCLCHGLGNK